MLEPIPRIPSSSADEHLTSPIDTGIYSDPSSRPPHIARDPSYPPSTAPEEAHHPSETSPPFPSPPPQELRAQGPCMDSGNSLLPFMPVAMWPFPSPRLLLPHPRKPRDSLPPPTPPHPNTSGPAAADPPPFPSPPRLPREEEGLEAGRWAGILLTGRWAGRRGSCVGSLGGEEARMPEPRTQRGRGGLGCGGLVTRLGDGMRGAYE